MPGTGMHLLHSPYDSVRWILPFPPVLQMRKLKLRIVILVGLGVFLPLELSGLYFFFNILIKNIANITLC